MALPPITESVAKGVHRQPPKKNTHGMNNMTLPPTTEIASNAGLHQTPVMLYHQPQKVFRKVCLTKRQ